MRKPIGSEEPLSPSNENAVEASSENLNISSPAEINPSGSTQLPKWQFKYLGWLSYFIPLALYFAGALFFTWPLALHLGDQVISTGSGDTWQHLWHTWWVKYSLVDLKALPFYTDMLYFPQRVDLLLDSLNVTTGLLSIPFQLVFGLVLTFNLLILFSLTLSGYGAFLLTFYLCENKPAAFVSGIIYAFCPLMALWLNLGQLDLIPTFWFPLFVLFYLKVLKGEKWINNAIFAVACFVGMSLTSWYFCYYGLIFSGLAFFYYLFQKRQQLKMTAWRGVITLAAGGLALAPVLVRTLATVGGEQNIGRQTYFNLWLNSAALSDFFIPGPSALWSWFGSRQTSDYQWLFLGFLALGLAIYGLLSNFKQAWFWGLIGLIFIELSLGPTLRFAVKNEVLAKPSDALNGIPTPNRILYNLPFGDVARVPLVSVIIVVLVTGVLAAFGLDRLMKQRGAARFNIILPGAAAILIFLEFLPIPRTLVAASYPSFYDGLKNQVGNFAVIDLPDASDAVGMFYQTLYQKPMVGGYTARKPPYFFGDTPGIKELRSTYPSTLPRDIFDPVLLQNTPAVLYYYNIQYAVFHLNLPTVSDSYRLGELSYIQSVFGDVPPLFEDKDIMVWRVQDLPGSTNPCGAKSILPGRMGGWNEREINEQGEVQRWIDGNAEVNFVNPSTNAVKLSLQTEAQSYLQPRRLQILKDGKVLQEFQISSEKTALQISLTLQPGANRVQLKTIEPGVKVENRVRAVLFYSFKLTDPVSSVCK